MNVGTVGHVDHPIVKRFIPMITPLAKLNIEANLRCKCGGYKFYRKASRMIQCQDDACKQLYFNHLEKRRE